MPPRIPTLLLCACLAARADEGMWTFDNPPLQQMNAAYGFAPDERWLEHARLASVEFGSASGAFVSRDGLVLTNHHVCLKYIENVSGPGAKDYAKLGFLARSRAEEIRLPDLRLFTLMRTVNVTDRVNAAVRPGMDEPQAENARKAVLTRLRDDLDGKDGLTVVPVTLHRGGEYWLYAYKVHRDVRLVMAPEAQIAFFGGDPENWTFPRHALDFALVRVYEGGAPYRPPHYLKWAREGAQPGDLTFVVGCPAVTRRQDTLAQMKAQRDAALPEEIAAGEACRAALLEYGKGSPERAREVSLRIFSLENSIKALKGELAGLQDPEIFRTLEQQESELRKAVAGNPGLQAVAGQSWDRIEAAVGQMKVLDELSALVNRRKSRLLRAALDVVRCAQELDRPRAERLAAYRTGDDERFEKWLLERPLAFPDPELETTLIAQGLEDIRQRLGPEHPFRKAVLGDRDPLELAREVVSGTKLQAMYARRDLIRKRSKGVAKSEDPLVRLARALESFARDLDWKREGLQAVMKDHEGRIARARFSVHGETLYPDATGTLRFSYGALEGYRENGRFVEPFTTFDGFYEKARRHGPEAAGGAWALPPRWLERKDRLDLTKPLNFCHKVDIVGGNSGSPTLNTAGEILGVLFDSNLQSLPGTFHYDGTVNRAVSLDGRAILEALVKIYDAPFLVDELTAP